MNPSTLTHPGLTFDAAACVPLKMVRSAILHALRGAATVAPDHDDVCRSLGCATVAERSLIADTLDAMVAEGAITNTRGHYRARKAVRT